MDTIGQPLTSRSGSLASLCIPGETVVCIHISLADNLPEIATWDPDEVVIRVAKGFQPSDVLREVRDILMIDLGAPASHGSLLRCFCGMPVELPRELLLRELVTAEVC